MPLTKQFVQVNKDWTYIIQLEATPAVLFEHQEQTNNWMVHTQGAEFRLLPDETAVRLLNEALIAGGLVTAINKQTCQKLQMKLK